MPAGRLRLLTLAVAALSSGPAGAAPPAGETKPLADIVAEAHHSKACGALEGGVRVFKGIPYTMATISLNRFHPPKLTYSLLVDGIILPKEPWQPDAPTVSAVIPMIIGITGTETTAPLAPLPMVKVVRQPAI